MAVFNFMHNVVPLCQIFVIILYKDRNTNTCFNDYIAACGFHKRPFCNDAINFYLKLVQRHNVILDD